MKYLIYAGLGGGFGGANLIDDEPMEFSSFEEAMRFAYDTAFEEYESYEGMHGLLDWNECAEELYPDRNIDDLTPFEEQQISDYYLEEVESWIDYYVEEVKE